MLIVYRKVNYVHVLSEHLDDHNQMSFRQVIDPCSAKVMQKALIEDICLFYAALSSHLL